MAGPTQKRNAALTFAAAGATIGIILAILAGPSVMECSSSTLGFGDCMRDKVAGLGLLPPREVTPEPVVVAEPEPAPPAEETPASEPAVETFALTLLRAEPDGSLVIGGRAKPGEDVIIFGNGAPIGSTKAEPSGDWAFVPDKPLTPGGTEITVGTADGATLAPEAFVVIIDQQPAVEARVLTSTPGQAAAVLGAIPLAVPDGAAEPEVAVTPEPEATAPEAETTPPTAEVAATPEPAAGPEVETPATPEIDQVAIDAGKAAAEAAAAAPVTQVAAVPEIVAPEREPMAEVAATPDAAAIAAGAAAAAAALESPVVQIATLPEAVAPAVEPEVVAGPDAGQVAMDAGRAAAAAAIASPVIVVAALPEPAVAVPDAAQLAADTGRIAAEAAIASPVTQEIIVATVEPDAVVVEPDVAAVPMTAPTIEAIEIDGGQNFFAGAGEEGATVRLYVEDAYVGDSKVEGGRWLVEAERALTRPSQRVRVDMMAADGSTVAATASINFVIDMPLPEGAEVVQPPEVATVAPETKPDGAPQSAADRSVEVAAPTSTPGANRSIEAGDKPAVADAVPPVEPSLPDATRTADRGDAVPAPVVVEEPQFDVAALEAGKAAAGAALLTPLVIGSRGVEAPAVDQAALDAGAAAAAAATAAPVTVETRVAEIPAAIEVVAEDDPQAALDAGRVAAELALLNPRTIAVTPPAEVAAVAPEAAVEPAPAVEAPPAEDPAVAVTEPMRVEPEVAAVEPAPSAEDASRAGAEAARVALADPVVIVMPPAAEPELAPPPAEVAVVEPEPEAATPPADVAAVEPEPDAVTPPADVAVVEPEPAVVTPPAEVAAVKPDPAAAAVDAVAAEAAGEAAAEVAAASPVTVATLEPAAEEEIPTLTAVPLDDELSRFATGKVIIRRGDTLWDIAERVYGSGTKYRTIYRANRNQIRRPGRIYPGQVFDLPIVYDD